MITETSPEMDQFLANIEADVTRDELVYALRVLGIPDSLHDLYAWNDDPMRTHAEVLAALYKAAELSEAS